MSIFSNCWGISFNFFLALFVCRSLKGQPINTFFDYKRKALREGLFNFRSCAKQMRLCLLFEHSQGSRESQKFIIILAKSETESPQQKL